MIIDTNYGKNVADKTDFWLLADNQCITKNVVCITCLAGSVYF